jgi:hypothetical protein
MGALESWWKLAHAASGCIAISPFDMAASPSLPAPASRNLGATPGYQDRLLKLNYPRLFVHRKYTEILQKTILHSFTLSNFSLFHYFIITIQ